MLKEFFDINLANFILSKNLGYSVLKNLIHSLNICALTNSKFSLIFFFTRLDIFSTLSLPDNGW